jgi:hypothetical protein
MMFLVTLVGTGLIKLFGQVRQHSARHVTARCLPDSEDSAIRLSVHDPYYEGSMLLEHKHLQGVLKGIACSLEYWNLIGAR